ncbi:hypothetical protein PUN28_009724 [Cardiocondyla obscurior]|uniref:Uncharacterized protein n=1 Tax=Cardiocondyla obscurior TaxID=286306 RepID=A0AAW2FLN4_9HYME
MSGLENLDSSKKGLGCGEDEKGKRYPEIASIIIASLVMARQLSTNLHRRPAIPTSFGEILTEQIFVDVCGFGGVFGHEIKRWLGKSPADLASSLSSLKMSSLIRVETAEPNAFREAPTWAWACVWYSSLGRQVDIPGSPPRSKVTVCASV